MTVTSDTAALASWLYRATRRLVHVDRRAALRLILSMSVNQIITVLVFFLPLKIVLLVAAEGVPEYFKFFISPNTKTSWLAALSATIFLLYIVSLRLDNIATRSASQGAETLVGACPQVPVTSDPTEFARTTFYRLGETVGCLAFSFLALLGGIIIFPSFFSVIPLLLAFEFWIVHLVTGKQGAGVLHRVGRYIEEQPQNILNYLQDASFLIIFGLLILYFVILQSLNPLLGIAAIMLSRRILGSVKRVFQNGIRFSKNQQVIDALLFTEVQVSADEGAEQGRILSHSTPASRPRRLGTLARLHSPDGSVNRYTDDWDTLELIQSVDKSVWVDSGRKGTAIFDLYGQDFDGEYKRLFRDYLYTRRASRGLEQQDYLLMFLEPEALRCPRRLLGYRYENLVGRMVDFRGMSELGAEAWQNRREELLSHLWCLDLPTSLVQGYYSAHPRLEERLDSGFLAWLSAACDEAWAESVYNLIASKISEIRERVSELPLTLVNERLGRRNVLVGPTGGSLFADWTRWAIEPMGAGFRPERDAREVLAVGAEGREWQKNGERAVSVNDVLLGSLLHRMEWLARKGYPKAALNSAWGLLPLLEEPDAVIVDELSLGEQEIDDDEAETV